MKDKLTSLKKGYTFDDLLLEPAYSEVTPDKVDLSSELVKGISLAVPLVSSPMDTVTEGEMAIAMALLGGIGIIHKNLSIEKQRKEVDKVKRYVTGIISDPITVNEYLTLGDLRKLIEKYRFSTFPVLSDGKLVGIISNRDTRFEEDYNKEVKDMMTVRSDLVTLKEPVSIFEYKKIFGKHRIEQILLTDDQFRLQGMVTAKDILQKDIFPNSTKDEKGRLRTGAAIGVVGDYKERASELVKYGCDIIVVDTAHGHSKMVLDAISSIRKDHPDLKIIGGNVATSEAVKALVGSGVDAVRVGIGPGSICTTRIISGVGVPQVTAINNASIEACRHNVKVIADGGIKSSGDIVKAIAAGADTIMIGSIFAGVEEAPGEKILFQGRVYKEYRGMGSIGAMEEGSSERYFQMKSKSGSSKFVPEGVEGRVPYKGTLEFVVHQLTGGMKSGLGYVGAKNIKELKEKGTFVKISNAGLKESHVHDVSITKEAPNYTMQ